MTNPQLRDPADVADAYATYANDVELVALQFANKYHQDHEEVHAQACLHFLEAFHSHDPGRSLFRTRLKWFIWNALLDALRTATRRYKKHPQEPLTREVLPATRDPEPFDGDGLGSDARTVLGLLLDSPADLNETFRSACYPGPYAIKVSLRQYLRDTLGWSALRVMRTFTEIRTSLR